MNDYPTANNAYLAPHIKLLTTSYESLTGRRLIDVDGSEVDVAKAIFEANFAVLSSGTEIDPLFNYANRCALDLFELDWKSLVALPARESAEPDHQDTRAQLMQRVMDQGFIDNYSGTRISSTGKRFVIEHATVWNVVDALGRVYGQAATFSSWTDA